MLLLKNAEVAFLRALASTLGNLWPLRTYTRIGECAFLIQVSDNNLIFLFFFVGLSYAKTAIDNIVSELDVSPTAIMIYSFGDRK